MNRWVGIVSLRDAPVVTPVHRIALAIEAANRRRSYVFDGRDVSYSRMRAEIRSVARRYAFLQDWERWNVATDTVRWFHDGAVSPRSLPDWLSEDLRPRLRPRKHAPVTSTPPPQRHSSASVGRRTAPAFRRAQRETPRPALSPRPSRGLRSIDVIRRSLRELPQECTSIPLSIELVNMLRRHGIDVRKGSQLAHWLALATCHSSYFYENRHIFPDVSDETLTMLGRVGAAAADVMIADDYTSRFAPDELGLQNKAIVTLRPLVRNELGLWIAGMKAVLLGLGEAQGKAASVSQYVAYQVIGVLVLHGHLDTVRLLLRVVCPSLLDSPAAHALEPVTTLHKYVPAQEMSWTYVAKGPQHDQTFTATAVDARGRQAQGVAASKKKARSAAAESFLDMYEPQWRGSSEKGPTSRRNPSAYQSAGRDHDDAVADLQKMFELPPEIRPWLAQALTHSSYTYEHKAESAAAHQRDNTLLANHGSFVLNFLAAEARARAVLSRTLSPEDDEARIVTPTNASCRALGEALFLRTGYLLGRGETSGAAAESVENPAQAVAAVAWRTHGSRMLLRRPEVLDHWLSALDNAQDPHTQLHALCSAYGVQIEDQYSEIGAQHERSYWCTLILRQEGRTLRWRGTDAGSNKTRAKLLASQELLDILDASLSIEEHNWSASEREALRFLLAAQMRGISALKARARTKSAARGDLGVALLTTGDIDSFLAWTREVEELVGPVPGHAREGIAGFYKAALFEARTGPSSAIARAERSRDGDSSAIAATFAATAVRRAKSQPETGTLRDVIARWWQEQARATPVQLNDELLAEEPHLLPAQLGAVREVLNWCGEAAASIDSRINIEFDARCGKTHLLVAMPGVDVAATCSALSDVLTRSLPFVDCMPDEERLLVRLTDIPDTEHLGSLAQLGIDAYVGA